MLTAIFTFITTLLGAVFWFVSKVVGFAFSLPLWLIVATNAIGTFGVVAIVYLVAQSLKRNAPKKQ